METVIMIKTTTTTPTAIPIEVVMLLLEGDPLLSVIQKKIEKFSTAIISLIPHYGVHHVSSFVAVSI